MHRDDLVTYDYTARLCGVWGYEEEDFPQPDLMPGDGDSITFGSASLSVIHTPGHTPGSICLYGEKVLFTGDTLFRGSAGRTDLPGGNATQLLQSLKALAGLPPLTRVFCGHDEETTLEREKAANPFMLAQQGPDVTA
jgi:glyoxylase-like metal-dependent hydrolase (beta-lactamase superfamily II)